MCELLSYLCDCELQHRVEAIVAFGDIYVSKLQANQKFRYNELMQALNMSAALTARKTREFRSPPQEQVSPILSYIPIPMEKGTWTLCVIFNGLKSYGSQEESPQHQEIGLSPK